MGGSRGDGRGKSSPNVRDALTPLRSLLECHLSPRQRRVGIAVGFICLSVCLSVS